MKKRCEYCGKFFETKYYTYTICSKKCRDLYQDTTNPRSTYRERNLFYSYISVDRKKGQFTCNEDYHSIHEMVYLFDRENCYYCKGIGKFGFDRLDNNKGHQKDNVVVCCLNRLRNDKFTSKEFKNIFNKKGE